MRWRLYAYQEGSPIVIIITMAFDRPIEADRVDNLGFLSSFVRAPLVAPILWAIGGLLPEDKENVLNPVKKLEEDLTSRGTTDHDASVSSKKCKADSIEIKSQDSIDILCETSNQHISSNSLRRNAANFETLSGFRYHHNQAVDQDDDNEYSNLWHRQKNRKMSWSDESGQDLVQYCIEVSARSFVEVNHSVSYTITRWPMIDDAETEESVGTPYGMVPYASHIVYCHCRQMKNSPSYVLLCRRFALST